MRIELSASRIRRAIAVLLAVTLSVVALPAVAFADPPTMAWQTSVNWNPWDSDNPRTAYSISTDLASNGSASVTTFLRDEMSNSRKFVDVGATSIDDGVPTFPSSLTRISDSSKSAGLYETAITRDGSKFGVLWTEIDGSNSTIYARFGTIADSEITLGDPEQIATSTSTFESLDLGISDSGQTATAVYSLGATVYSTSATISGSPLASTWSEPAPLTSSGSNTMAQVELSADGQKVTAVWRGPTGPALSSLSGTISAGTNTATWSSTVETILTDTADVRGYAFELNPAGTLATVVWQLGLPEKRTVATRSASIASATGTWGTTVTNTDLATVSWDTPVNLTVSDGATAFGASWFVPGGSFFEPATAMLAIGSVTGTTPTTVTAQDMGDTTIDGGIPNLALSGDGKVALRSFSRGWEGGLTVESALVGPAPMEWSEPSGVSDALDFGMNLALSQTGSVASSAEMSGGAMGNMMYNSVGKIDLPVVGPTNTEPPDVTGTPTVRETLTTTDGEWTSESTITYSYQWQRCDTAVCDGTVTDIDDATDATYELTDDDYDLWIRSKVTATNDDGFTDAFSTPTAQIAGIAPTNSVLPEITGSPVSGQTLSVSDGTWDAAPPITGYTYEWFRCETAACSPSNTVTSVGTSQTYLLGAADLGKYLYAVVTATNPVDGTEAQAATTDVITGIEPENTVPPVLSGTPVSGQTMNTTDGTWTGEPPPTITYQWMRCDDSACATESPIPDATNSSYLLGDDDVDKWIRVQVTGTGYGDPVIAYTGIEEVSGLPPVNTVAPAITGTAEVDAQLSASTGTWTGSPTPTYAYQWQRCADTDPTCASPTDIGGATSATYTLTDDDYQQYVRVKVTATNSEAPEGVVAYSDPTAQVAASDPANTVAPAVTGSTVAGQTLTTTTGTWTGYPDPTFTYQWETCTTADCTGGTVTPIGGATGSTYELTEDEIGMYIRVKVTGTNSGSAVDAYSNVTAIVTGVPPVNTVAPVVTGTRTTGQTLTTDHGTWTGIPAPTTFTYQWQRCASSDSACASPVDIASATGSTYVLINDDIGSYVRVQVTADNGTTPGYGYSAPGSVIAGIAPANTVAPAISGTTTLGETLSTTDGTWTGEPAPTDFAYQWQYCDTAACSGTVTDIDGATASAYVLADVTYGKYVRVRVTATNSTSSVAAYSDATAAIAGVAPVNSVIPAITGTTTAGQTLTADEGTWSGRPTPTYSYQWQRCASSDSACASPVDIAGATGDTYVLTADDVSAFIRVEVVATNVVAAVPAYSTPTSAISAQNVANTTPPSVAGSGYVDTALTADPGAWTGIPAPSISYQWQLCEDATCSDTTTPVGTDSATFTPTGTMVGKWVRVSVTATNAGNSVTLPTSTIQVIQGPALTPQFGTSSLTVDGATTQITNYAAEYDWTAVASTGVATISPSGLITVTGVKPGSMATVTVTVSRTGYLTGTADYTFVLPISGIVLKFVDMPEQIVPGQNVKFNLDVTKIEGKAFGGVTTRGTHGINGTAVVTLRNEYICTAQITNGTGSCWGVVRELGKLEFGATFNGTAADSGAAAAAAASAAAAVTSATVAIQKTKFKVRQCRSYLTLKGRDVTAGRKVKIQYLKQNGKWGKLTVTRTKKNKKWATTVHLPVSTFKKSTVVIRANDGVMTSASLKVRLIATRGC